MKMKENVSNGIKSNTKITKLLIHFFKSPHKYITAGDHTTPKTLPIVNLHVPTFVSCDRDDLPHRGRHAEDVSTLDTPLCLHVVLKGAVDPRWQIRNITSLEDQLGRERKEGQSVQDQWKDTVYMDCYKIWHEG